VVAGLDVLSLTVEGASVTGALLWFIVPVVLVWYLLSPVGRQGLRRARVLEIRTPRWTAYDARFYGVKMDPKVPMTTQERAYTSLIWYTPGQP
jgi:hypothetical protein